MNSTILVLNAGSSSIKFALFSSDALPARRDLLCRGEYEGIGGQTRFRATDGAGAALPGEALPAGASHLDALAALMRWLAGNFPQLQLSAAGHRVVHGGSVYARPVLIDATVIAELRRLIPLAPLHQPHHLDAILALEKLHPGLPQVACFDTAFHRTQPEIAANFALPRELTADGIKRYGFHGLSYEYIASVLPDVAGPRVAGGRVVVAHLGNGASMCAMLRGRSIATTMGFTALDGLPMGQRCGSLDPGVILYMLSEMGMPEQTVSDILYHHSGLLGVSGISNDMRTLLASTDPHAREAIDLFIYRIGRELGSLAAALGGLDAVVFTAGIGEHAAEIRRRVCEQASWLGIEIDDARNDADGPRITADGAVTSAWVIPTDEDLMIARHSWALVHPANSAG